MESKKAQNLSVTTIILIILGVVVLVVLIIGFTKGWGSVKEFFTGGPTSAYISQCAIACSTGDQDGWCEKNYTVEIEEGTIQKTCQDLATDGEIDSCATLEKTCTRINIPKYACESVEIGGDICYTSESANPRTDCSGETVDTTLISNAKNPGEKCCKVACVDWSVVNA